MQIIIQLFLLIIGFVMLLKGADFFVDGASAIAERFHIPQLVIGLTIVAMGTSVPEAAVSIASAMKGNAGITVGNVLGSNILNVLLILGITAAIRPVEVQKSTLRYEIPFVIVVTLILSFLGLKDNRISRIEGGILWIFMILYLGYLYLMTKNSHQDASEKKSDEEKESIIKMILYVIGGGILIIIGADVTVDAATKIARIIGMNERVIGLTIVAFGTSLPELITSVTATIKKKADIAVGNIVGSNIFNILFVIGTSALITPVEYSKAFMFDSIIATVSMVVLLILSYPKEKLGRKGGGLMFGGYMIYLIYLLNVM